jgi:hypothetical protein
MINKTMSVSVFYAKNPKESVELQEKFTELDFFQFDIDVSDLRDLMSMINLFQSTKVTVRYSPDTSTFTFLGENSRLGEFTNPIPTTKHSFRARTAIISAIQTQEDYEKALAAVEKLMVPDPEPDSERGRQLKALAALIGEYEAKKGF